MKNKSLNILDTRETAALARLDDLRAHLEDTLQEYEVDDLCLYITGSYGRLEASEHSDLDIFFVRKGTAQGHSISKVEQTLIDAAIINVCRDLGFPEFSGGGEYLSVHYLDDIVSSLGHAKDDYNNHFTARMLLLLESRYLLNEITYSECLANSIAAYYNDYHGHEKDFRPVFLVNDILRFWRTLCMNYEHNRMRKDLSDPIARRKSYLKNLKLKFSRMMTCYSAIAGIVAIEGAVSISDLLMLFEKSPIDRVKNISQQSNELTEISGKLLDEYGWFLKQTGRSEADTLRWIARSENRNRAFERARKFGRMYFEFVKLASRERNFEYLVI